MPTFQQNESSSSLRRFPVYLVSSTDGLTPATGEAGGQPQVTKAGTQSFSNTLNTLEGIGNGYYEVVLGSSEVDTLGTLTVRYNSTNNVAEFNLSGKVVAYDPYSSSNLGLGNLDASISSRSTHSSTDILSDATPFAGANIDASISSRSTHSSTDVIAETLTELSTGQPPASPSLGESLMLPYMALRNKETQSSTEYAIHDSSSGKITVAGLSDDGSVVTKDQLKSSTA